MLDLIKLQKDVEDWIYDFVSVYNKDLEAIPCPFAKEAVASNKIIWKLATTDYELEKICKDYTDQELWTNKEVLTIGIRPDHISAESLTSNIEHLNKNVLQPVGLIALEDHPDKPEIVSDVKMNQGSWALVLIQSSDKLQHASKILKSRGYYDKWSQEQLDEVVNWR